MGIRMPRVTNLKKILNQSSFLLSPDYTSTVPKGCLAVYIGEKQRRRFVVPISYLNDPAFQDLLNQAEEEFIHSPFIHYSLLSGNIHSPYFTPG